MRVNSDNDSEEVIDTTRNQIAARQTHHFEDFHHTPGTVECIKNALKHHYKINLRLEDGWTFDTIKKNCVGNPCDLIEVKELVSGSCNVSEDRGDVSENMAPMKVDYLIKMSMIMLHQIKIHPNFRVEVLCF